jgi:hypothetical protein
MIDFQSGYILRPVSAVFIYFSLFCALLLNLLPIGNYGWVPDWLIICIVEHPPTSLRWCNHRIYSWLVDGCS